MQKKYLFHNEERFPRVEHLDSVCFGRQAVLLSNTPGLARSRAASLSSRTFPVTVIGCRSHVIHSHTVILLTDRNAHFLETKPIISGSARE